LVTIGSFKGAWKAPFVTSEPLPARGSGSSGTTVSPFGAIGTFPGPFGVRVVPNEG
jgi:hypothetical protein